jgi:hypothetical protein
MCLSKRWSICSNNCPLWLPWKLSTIPSSIKDSGGYNKSLIPLPLLSCKISDLKKNIARILGLLPSFWWPRISAINHNPKTLLSHIIYSPKNTCFNCIFMHKMSMRINHMWLKKFQCWLWFGTLSSESRLLWTPILMIVSCATYSNQGLNAMGWSSFYILCCNTNVVYCLKFLF